MSFYTKSAKCRNAHSGRDVSKYLDIAQPEGDLSPGGRVVYRRLRRSVSLCNALAELAGIGTGRAA